MMPSVGFMTVFSIIFEQLFPALSASLGSFFYSSEVCCSAFLDAFNFGLFQHCYNFELKTFGNNHNNGKDDTERVFTSKKVLFLPGNVPQWKFFLIGTGKTSQCQLILHHSAGNETRINLEVQRKFLTCFTQASSTPITVLKLRAFVCT